MSILIETTRGCFTIDLAYQQVPVLCRSLLALCAIGYYDGTLFHRVQDQVAVYGGDPTGSGLGGTSIGGYVY